MSNKASTANEVPTMAHRDDLIIKIQAVLRGYYNRKRVLQSNVKGAGMKSKPNTNLQSESNQVMVYAHIGDRAKTGQIFQ